MMGLFVKLTMEEIIKSAWATIIYYDVLNWPLTAPEVSRFLINPGRWAHGNILVGEVPSTGRPRRLRIDQALEQLIAQKKIDSRLGFYFLPGRQRLVNERLEKQKIAEEKWKRARRHLRWAQFLPYLEGVLASGSLALGNTGWESDLDVLVIARHRRIWLVRLLLILLLGFLGVRRRNNQPFAPDKICLNHFVATDSLNIPWPSLYNAQTYLHLAPLFLRSPAVAEDFWLANRWMSGFVSHHWSPPVYQEREVINRPFLRGIARLAEVVMERTGVGQGLNWLAKKIQKRRIKINLPGRVVASDRQLEFHPYSAEAEILRRYNKAVSSTGYFSGYHEVDSGLKTD